MKQFFILLTMFALCSCSKTDAHKPGSEFITVNERGEFVRGDSVYRFTGANFWAAPILASEGRGGDRERLHRELDRLQQLGISNLRILVGAQARHRQECLLQPVLEEAPGVYNDTLLAGLDYLMAELERRDMTAVLYLNNAWEWSGGYTSYLEWAGEGEAVLPTVDGYQEYCEHAGKFIRSDSAQALFARHVENIVPRYAQSPALLSWQICNEPRSYGRTPEQKERFVQWLLATAQQIHRLDPNHLVSTGSEGSVGCEMDIELWTRIHAMPEIDYATIHIWPTNWGWVRRDEATDSVDRAIRFTDEYLAEHSERMRALGKPLVLEEFGYPRDNGALAPGTPVTARDRYYDHLLRGFRSGTSGLAGLNFWAWGGEGIPDSTYTGDPAHEPQGLFSVFATDPTTF